MVTFAIRMEPFLVNGTRGKHRLAQARHTETWVDEARSVAFESKTPCFVDPVGITVYHYTGNKKGRMPDCGACVLSAKAAIDGFVQAGVLVDDSPKFLHWLKFVAPVRHEFHQLVFTIEAVPSDG